MKQFIVLFSFILGVSFGLPTTAGELNRPLRINLYDDYSELINSGATPEDIFEMNKKALQEIYNFQIPFNEKRTSAISVQQAEVVLETLVSNPIASPYLTFKYDPMGVMGFCFGRALFVHLELLRRGVQKESIKKAFAVGPMNGGGINWQFHVTTVVKAKTGEWLAIDPFVGRIMRIEDWFDEMSKQSTDAKLRFYLSEPAKLGPSSWEYNLRPGGLYDEVYHNYFRELLAFFRRNPVSCRDRFQ
jgi:hypothetical protein